MVILNKILVMLFIFSILNIIRHLYYLIQVWVKSNNENPQKYYINKSSLIILGLTISYFVACLFEGIKIN